MGISNNSIDAGAGSSTAAVPETSLLHVTELARVRAHLAAVVESSEDAIISKTLEGIVTSWNRAAERLFGFTPDEMVGQSILKIIPAELQYEEANILAKIRAGERIERYETVRVHKDGHRVDISLTISPVKDPSGLVAGAG